MDGTVAGWSVRDLAETAGTTVRTIHYYISEGLLPPPVGATRSATYSPAHLARLRLIGALREEGLALASIRQRLAPLSDDEALEIVAELDEHLAQADVTPLTTLGLIEAALASRQAAAAEPAAFQAAPLTHDSMAIPSVERASVAEPGPAGGSASEYLNRVMRKPSRPGSESRPVPLPRPKPPDQKPRDLNRPEAWYHVQIEDGIELRVREDRYRESAGRLRAVVDSLRDSIRRYGLARPNKDGT